jgi:hypothetical protein
MEGKAGRALSMPMAKNLLFFPFSSSFFFFFFSFFPRYLTPRHGVDVESVGNVTVVQLTKGEGRGDAAKDPDLGKGEDEK